MNTLGMFAKYWQPGTVKTRLAQCIGEPTAAAIYASFVAASLQRFADTADRRVLSYWPPERRDDFANLVAGNWQLAPQCAGDLGTRMRNFFCGQLNSADNRVVLIGSDSPTLPLHLVDEAFRLLDEFPVVLGPSSDGGYYLVGAKGDVPPIFEGITWSTRDVWQQTTERLDAADCPFARLPEWYDVDDYQDLTRLRHELAELTSHPSWCKDLLATIEAAL